MRQPDMHRARNRLILVLAILLAFNFTALVGRVAGWW